MVVMAYEASTSDGKQQFYKAVIVSAIFGASLGKVGIEPLC
jgi:hypothetical protein